MVAGGCVEITWETFWCRLGDTCGNLTITIREAVSDISVNDGVSDRRVTTHVCLYDIHSPYSDIYVEARTIVIYTPVTVLSLSIISKTG